MLTNEIIVRCVDLARKLAEETGPKEAKYYKRNWLSAVFGIYSKPIYPEANSVRGVEDLWKGFEPRLATSKQKAELMTAWVKTISPNYILDPEAIIEKVEAIKTRHTDQSNVAKAGGFHYQFMEPFHTIARDLDNTVLKAILAKPEQQKQALHFKDSSAALEHAIAFGANEASDGAVLIGIVKSVKQLGPLSVLQVGIAVNRSMREEYVTVASEYNILPDDLLALLCGRQDDKIIIVPIAVLEPILHPTEGWKIRSKIH